MNLIYLFFSVWGKQTLLKDFSFKKPSHTAGRPSIFSAKKLLKQSQLNNNEAASVHKLKIPKMLQFDKKSIDKPDLVKSVRKQEIGNTETKENLAKPDLIRLNTPEGGENKNMQLLNSKVISSQTDQVTSTKVSQKDIQLKTSFLDIGPNPDTKKKGMFQEKTNALDLGLFTSAKEAHDKHLRVLDYSSTPIPQSVTSQTDIEFTTPNTVNTLGLKPAVRTPTPIDAIPFCSWIDPYKCQDVSTVQPECIEYPKVNSLYGECKTCPIIISWCFEPNDMIGSGKLHDNSPQDVVLIAGNMKAPKLALAISRPAIL